MFQNNKEMPLIKPGKQDNYDIAYREAAMKLSVMNIKDVALNSGASVINQEVPKGLILTFLNSEIIVEYPEISIKYKNSVEEVPEWLRILALHYLVTSKGTKENGDKITFKQIEGGLVYYPVFQKRSIKPLIKVFGDDFSGFIKCGAILGGKEVPFGDFAVKFRTFPNVEITFVIWHGDDEFPVEGNVLFDSSIQDYLSPEDIAILCNMTAVMVIKAYYAEKSRK